MDEQEINKMIENQIKKDMDEWQKERYVQKIRYEICNLKSLGLIRTKIKIKMQSPYPKLNVVRYFCSYCGKLLVTRTENLSFGPGLVIAEGKGSCDHFTIMEVDRSTPKQQLEELKKKSILVGVNTDWKYVLIIPK